MYEYCLDIFAIADRVAVHTYAFTMHMYGQPFA